jgi:hypothetical protein
MNPLRPEWPKEVADLVERVVGKVRSLFTNRAVMITNALVFGAIAVAGAGVAAVLGITMLFRSIQSYLTWNMDTTAQIILGVLALAGLAFAIAGLVTSNPGLTALGAFVAVVAGTRWILDVTETYVDHDTAVWISYMLIGGWLMMIGMYFMLQRREPRTS